MAEIKNSYEYTGGGTNTWSTGSVVSSTAGGECTAIGGTQGSALANGGYIGGYNAESESYDGSGWSTSPANLSANQAYGSGTGTSSEDYLIVGGYNGSVLDTSYTYDGTWSSSFDLANARNVGSLMGTPADACLTGGGRIANNDSEIFAGASWATGPTPSDDRYHANPSTNCGGTNGSATLGGGTASGVGYATNLIMHLDKS